MKFLDVPQSGSIAGTTHSHNRAGQYTRNRRAPVQPIGTGRRAFVRALFAGGASGFAALSATDQDAWTSFAALHPITDSLGQTVVLTGQQMFVRVYASAVNVGQDPPTTPPASASPPNIAPILPTFSIATGLSVTFAAGTADQDVAGAVSQPLSPARRFWKTFWQPLGADGYVTAFSGTWALTTAKYAAEFGTPTIGQRVFVRMTPVDDGGFNGPPVIASCLVTA